MRSFSFWRVHDPLRYYGAKAKSSRIYFVNRFARIFRLSRPRHPDVLLVVYVAAGVGSPSDDLHLLRDGHSQASLRVEECFTSARR